MPPPPPRHECSSEVRPTRHPSGQLDGGQSRQMAVRGGGKKMGGKGAAARQRKALGADDGVRERERERDALN